MVICGYSNGVQNTGVPSVVDGSSSRAMRLVNSQPDFNMSISVIKWSNCILFATVIISAQKGSAKTLAERSASFASTFGPAETRCPTGWRQPVGDHLLTTGLLRRAGLRLLRRASLHPGLPWGNAFPRENSHVHKQGKSRPSPIMYSILLGVE
jgi:hypothetical protein